MRKGCKSEWRIWANLQIQWSLWADTWLATEVVSLSQTQEMWQTVVSCPRKLMWKSKEMNEPSKDLVVLQSWCAGIFTPNSHACARTHTCSVRLAKSAELIELHWCFMCCNHWRGAARRDERCIRRTAQNKRISDSLSLLICSFHLKTLITHFLSPTSAQETYSESTVGELPSVPLRLISPRSSFPLWRRWIERRFLLCLALTRL